MPQSREGSDDQGEDVESWTVHLNKLGLMQEMKPLIGHMRLQMIDCPQIDLAPWQLDLEQFFVSGCSVSLLWIA